MRGISESPRPALCGERSDREAIRVRGSLSGHGVRREPLTPTLSPRRCSDRRQGGRVFGDIVDTFGLAVEGPDVDGCNHLSSEDNVEDAIVSGGSERHSPTAAGFGDFDGAAEEADVTALLNTAHDVVRGIFEGRDGLDIVARARLIAAGRDSKLERRGR